MSEFNKGFRFKPVKSVSNKEVRKKELQVPSQKIST